MKYFIPTLALFCLSQYSFGAVSKQKENRPLPLSPAAMVEKGWRPTPTISESMKKGKFQGVETVASLPKLVGS